MAYYVVELMVIDTFTLIVSFAVVVSLKFTRESSTQLFAVAVAPMNTQHSSIVWLHTSTLEKNLSKYTTLSVLDVFWNVQRTNSVWS